MRTHRKGFTIVELLVVVSIIALLIAILLPAIGKARDAALLTQSLANLRNMGTANANYSADWSDRQWTTMPDDAGLAGGNCENYMANVGCPPAQLLGWDATGAIWGYFLPCNGPATGCGNWVVYMPMVFNTNPFGSFRLPNAKSFAGYVNNKYYDPVFWAPKDKINLAIAEKYFANPDQFVSTPPPNQEVAHSTYCFSPASMYAPEVFSSRGGFKHPNTMPGGYRSPAVGMARYPELKTRMLEHSWLQNAESSVNSNFAGGKEPWYFNHGYNSSPATLFFDGHVAVMGVAEAMESDTRAKKGNTHSTVNLEEDGLWVRQTPLGPGYFYNQRFDFLVNTSYHILTTDGILGRDTMGAK